MSYPSDWRHITLHASPDGQEFHFDGNKVLGQQVIAVMKGHASARGEILRGLREKVEALKERVAGEGVFAVIGRRDACKAVLALIDEGGGPPMTERCDGTGADRSGCLALADDGTCMAAFRCGDDRPSNAAAIADKLRTLAAVRDVAQKRVAQLETIIKELRPCRRGCCMCGGDAKVIPCEWYRYYYETLVRNQYKLAQPFREVARDA